jgi:hypothetical protein
MAQQRGTVPYSSTAVSPPNNRRGSGSRLGSNISNNSSTLLSSSSDSELFSWSPENLSSKKQPSAAHPPALPDRPLSSHGGVPFRRSHSMQSNKHDYRRLLSNLKAMGGDDLESFGRCVTAHAVDTLDCSQVSLYLLQRGSSTISSSSSSSGDAAAAAAAAAACDVLVPLTVEVRCSSATAAAAVAGSSGSNSSSSIEPSSAVVIGSPPGARRRLSPRQQHQHLSLDGTHAITQRGAAVPVNVDSSTVLGRVALHGKGSSTKVTTTISNKHRQ